MNQKIGTFLMSILVITAVLLLAATAQDDPGGTMVPPETTVMGTLEPVTEPEASGPAQMEENVSSETLPREEPDTGRNEGLIAQVERILDKGALVETAVTQWNPGAELNRIEGVSGRADTSAAHAMMLLARERRMNPIAAFWLLVNEGLYEKQEDKSGVMKSAAFAAPGQKAKRYDNTDDGAGQLLTDLIILAAQIEDDLDLESAILGEDLCVEAEQIRFSGQDDCRYAYFSCASEQVTHILCFYLRSDEGGAQIGDVEFQLLSVRHATGDMLSLDEIDGSFADQAASLIAAAELLMTGKTRAGEGQIPFAYEMETYQAKIQRYQFDAAGERGSLANYHLRTK